MNNNFLAAWKEQTGMEDSNKLIVMIVNQWYFGTFKPIVADPEEALNLTLEYLEIDLKEYTEAKKAIGHERTSEYV